MAEGKIWTAEMDHLNESDIVTTCNFDDTAWQLRRRKPSLLIMLLDALLQRLPSEAQASGMIKPW